MPDKMQNESSIVMERLATQHKFIQEQRLKKITRCTTKSERKKIATHTTNIIMGLYLLVVHTDFVF